MQKLSRIISFFVLCTLYFVLHPTSASAQVPGVKFPCDKTSENEFHSLRPYQASPCGNAKQALFCSNKLVIFETFDLSKEEACLALRRKQTGSFDCSLKYPVNAHNLNITLDESEFPIMGNTENEFDDAQKLNEYASWYLNGVIDKKENENPTDSQIVDFSGPVKKLIPSMIQDLQRIKTVWSSERIGVEVGAPAPNPLEIDDDLSNQPDNHDQLVVDNLRLSSWGEGKLSTLNSILNILPFVEKWNNRYPPLPWQFETEILYKKAYQEWQGKVCVIVPIFGLQCADPKIGFIDIVPNEWSDRWHFVPLSNNSDQKGKNYILTGDGPSYVPSQGTEIENDQHKSYKNAPLYFAHTLEVYELSRLLNTTFTPSGYKSEKLPETTEKIKKGISTATSPPQQPQPQPAPLPNNPNQPGPGAAPLPPGDPAYANLDCSAVNVRVNEGDNLFPGDRNDGKELYVEGAKYDITQVKCDEIYEPRRPIGCGNGGLFPCKEKWEIKCIAQVGIEFKLGTQTPYANEIFADTVADSGSTFRKIFPKVEKGAPVECIADIPTTTNVTYDINNPLNQTPNGGKQELKQTKYPADGGGDGTELTFPHVGSIYEYFLKGIQTALRPKGYGEPIANGICKPIDPVSCGEWEEKLEKSSGGICGICSSELGDLAKRILATAGKAYNVPATNIWAAMKHEGADGYQGTTYDFSDENVRKWSTSEQCGGEPMPGCDNNIATTQPPFGFLINWFYTNTGNADDIWNSVQKIDPTRDSKDKVSRCNFLDAAYGAANLLSQASTAQANGIYSCGKYEGFDRSRPGTCSGEYWDVNNYLHVAQSQTVYAGFCVNDLPVDEQQYTIEDAVSWYNDAKCN